MHFKVNKWNLDFKGEFTHDFNTNEDNYSRTKAIQKCFKFMYFIDNLAL